MKRLPEISRKRAMLVGLPLLLIVLLAVPPYWLLHTASGAAWLWSRLGGLDSIDVTYSQVKGDLASGFIIQDLNYRSDALDLSVRRVEIQARAAWWPASIEVRKLTLQDLDIYIQAGTSAAEQANEITQASSILGALELPVPLKIRDAVLTNIILRQEDDPAVMVVESIRFAATLDKQLVVERLDILSDALKTGLKGYLALTPPYELSVEAAGRLDYSVEAFATDLSLPFKLESSGDLDRLTLKLTSPENGLQLGGEIFDPLNHLHWNLDAALDFLKLPEEINRQGIALSELRLVSQGDVRGWSFGLDSAVRADQLPDARVVIAGTGSNSGIEITDATLTGPGLDLGVSGKLDWSAQTVAMLKTEIRQLDLSPWLPGWPAGEWLAGAFELNWSDKSLKIPTGQLVFESTGTTLDIEADIDIEADTVSARLNWSNLAWPLTGAAKAFSSRAGRLDVSGSTDDWLASGQLDIQLGDYPQGRFEINGGGNRTSTRVNIPSGEILGGVVSGEAGADWSDGLSWDAVIHAKGIDPGPLLGEWPGRLDGEIQIVAQSQPERVQINIAALQGVIRGVAINARGGIEMTESGLVFNSLEAHTDDAVLELDGAMSGPAGVTFKFNGNLPSVLLQDARGQVRLQGRYSGSATHPVLELQMQAVDVSWNGLSVGDLAVSTAAAAPTESPAVLQLDASSLAWKDVLLEDISLTVKPVGEGFELRLMLAEKDVALNSVMLLTPEKRNFDLNSNWQGVLTGFDLDLGPAYRFGLLQPAAFAWSSGSISMEPLCLSESAGPSLCVDIDYQANRDWSLVADATAVPIDYLRYFLELDVQFEQLLEGHLEWHQLHGQAPTGGAEFRITAGRILDLLDDGVLASTNEGRFAFTLQNGNLESGVLDIELPEIGFIDVNFDVLDIAGDGQRKLQGRALTRLDKLTLAGQVALPGVDAVDGQFESDIEISGSLANPEFHGGFKISNGLIDYAPIGLKLEDIEIQGQVQNRDRGDFDGSFRAGEGVASISGNFQFDDAGRPQLAIELAGDQLLLINTDALKIFADPELKIALASNRMDINGHITIPKASLTPAKLEIEEVRDSEDLVIENGETAPDAAAAATPAKTRIFGQLEVTLGKDVLVKVPDIEAKITGSTVFNWKGETVPMAKGSYRIRGKVDVYGPTLRINNGTVSFPDVPADNPLLNIRAGRDIYGNTQIRSAGVQVIGSLRRPVLEAYTVPVTNEDRAWALLVTGNDFDQSQGVSGFDLGTYIAPKLYVSYGVSLFQDENVISARYDLKKGFGVKVTSGQRETGLDISYTIDR